MNRTIDPSLYQMALIFTILFIPIILARSQKISMLKELSISVLRMTVQLCLMGLMLEFLFRKDVWWLTSLWLLVMLFFANMNLLQKTKLNKREFAFLTLVPIIVGSGFVLFYFVYIGLNPKTGFPPHYLIPLYGMILGNSMNANILALERFMSLMKDNIKEYNTWLAFGACPQGASQRMFTLAYRASMLPIVSNMATMGMVSLPGMMTGQILGGSSPMVAIKYQIGVIIAIFSAVSISSLLLLINFRHKILDENGMLKIIHTSV
jgi:putative ABC transport system permease protein